MHHRLQMHRIKRSSSAQTYQNYSRIIHKLHTEFRIVYCFEYSFSL